MSRSCTRLRPPLLSHFQRIRNPNPRTREPRTREPRTREPENPRTPEPQNPENPRTWNAELRTPNAERRTPNAITVHDSSLPNTHVRSGAPSTRAIAAEI